MQAVKRRIQLQASSYTIAGHPSNEGLWPPCRYTLANIETRKGVRQGDKVFQVGFGGGALALHATRDAACMCTSESVTQTREPRILLRVGSLSGQSAPPACHQ